MRAAVRGDDLAVLLELYQQESGASFDLASDRLMVSIAKSLLDGRLSYDDADEIANRWWALVLAPGRPATDSFPDLAYAIFLAIEQGEFNHSDGRDPVEQHVLPQLRAALSGNDG